VLLTSPVENCLIVGGPVGGWSAALSSGPTTAAGDPGDHQRIPEVADETGGEILMVVVVVVFASMVAADAVPEVALIESTLVAIAPARSKRASDRLGEWW
jgi:hypothetical protein